MQVGPDTVVTLDLELADFWGAVLQRSDAPVQYLHGGYDDILRPLEQALDGRSIGERVVVRLEPEEAFGDYDDALLRVEPRAHFPEALEVGMQFEGIPGAAGESGAEVGSDETIYTVTDIADDKVVLDGNHPLAGIGVEFRCTVREVRTASAEEIERGGVDDPGALALRIVTH